MLMLPSESSVSKPVAGEIEDIIKSTLQSEKKAAILEEEKKQIPIVE